MLNLLCEIYCVILQTISIFILRSLWVDPVRLAAKVLKLQQWTTEACNLVKNDNANDTLYVSRMA